MKRGNGGVPPLGFCGCGAGVHVHSFRNRISFDEYRLSGLCQRCQDEFFLGTSDEDPDARYVLRRGALATVRMDRSTLVELCVFPFILVEAPVPEIAWEARLLMRAGSRLDPVDVWHELAPIEAALQGHQVLLAELHSLAAPSVAERLGHIDLVMALDCETLGAVADLRPMSPGATFVNLRDGVPWTEAFGRHLRPLDTWSLRGRAGGSTLHACALIAYVLLARGRIGRPLDHLFGS